MPMELARTLADRQSQTHNARQAPRCRHIKTNGEPCRAAANRGQDLCHFHQNAQPSGKPERLPVLEDANSIQVALMIVMDGLYRYHIPHKTAALLLYGLQIAAANLRHLAGVSDPEPRGERESAAEILSQARDPKRHLAPAPALERVDL